MSVISLYKLEINGIVYLIDPKTATAYTYDIESPTPIGNIIRTPSGQIDIQYREDWRKVQQDKLDHRPPVEVAE
jgi:hypothetical protein